MKMGYKLKKKKKMVVVRDLHDFYLINSKVKVRKSVILLLFTFFASKHRKDLFSVKHVFKGSLMVLVTD